MKIFRELYIHLNGVDVETFYEKLEQSAKAPWIRKKDERAENSICFEASKDVSGVPVNLYILPRISPENTNTLWVSNIVPAETGKLTYEQYSSALKHFYENIVRPAINGTDVTVDLTSDETSIGSIAGDDVEKAFARFSDSVNKSTRGSHPRDRERWLEFLFLAHEAKSDLDPDIVIRSLVERGWSEEDALALGIQFEFACDVLSYAQKHEHRRHRPAHSDARHSEHKHYH